MSKPLSPAQKLFNKVARHLLRQQAKSIKDGVCFYRGPNGLRCAAGAVLPNRLYKKDMEYCAVDNPKVSPIFEELGYNINQLRSLQVIHDYTPVSEWKSDLIRHAEYNNLKMPTI